MKTLGLDISMTGTGWAIVTSMGVPSLGHDDIEHGLIKSKPGARVLKPGRREGSKLQRDYTRPAMDVAARLGKIVTDIEQVLWQGFDDIDLIVIESPSLGSKSANLDQLWGLYWATLMMLSGTRIPFATVAPRARAQYATGNGASDKKSVVDATVKRYELSTNDDNVCDAVLLAAMGLRHLHAPIEKTLPQANRDALAAVIWPTMKGTK